ncbi:MAG: hypothetical protein ACLQAT_09155 [Candidatus Binataceae bacterium]
MKPRARRAHGYPGDPVVTESPAFKAWFGASTVKERDGRPRAMYHGTYLDFESFDPRHHFHCFTPDPLIAERQARESYWSFKDDPRGAAIVVVPVYLRVLRPFDPRIPECIRLMAEWGLGDPGMYDYAEWDDLENLKVVERIKSLEFDGIWMRQSGTYDPGFPFCLSGDERIHP